MLKALRSPSHEHNKELSRTNTFLTLAGDGLWSISRCSEKPNPSRQGWAGQGQVKEKGVRKPDEKEKEVEENEEVL